MYKNKKLKSILAFTTLFCALGGIAFSSIITTSCSKKDKNINVEEYLDITTNEDVVTLNGPKKEIPQNGRFNTLRIPNYVTNIADSAFKDNKTGNAITKLTLEAGRKKALVFNGECAFYDCGFIGIDLSGITIESIGSSTFRKCTSLKTLNLSNLTTGSIGDDAFSDCASLKTIDASNLTTSAIESGAFSNCTSLEALDLSNLTTSSIGNDAFVNCVSLETVNLSNLTTGDIRDHAFRNCSSLKTLDLSNLTTGSIGNESFFNCHITAINLSNITGSIGTLAFDRCPLQNVVIGDASAYTWANNVGPAKILIKKDGHADSKFKWATDKQIGCIAYGNLQFPTDVEITTLADSFLEDCGGIKGNIVFPSTLSAIPTWCISSSLITSIDLPTSVSSFGNCAFAYNNSLKDVYIRNTTGVPYNTTNSGCFKECPLLSNGEGKFHVPSNLIDSYYNNEANGWTGKGFTFVAI